MDETRNRSRGAVDALSLPPPADAKPAQASAAVQEEPSEPSGPAQPKSFADKIIHGIIVGGGLLAALLVGLGVAVLAWDILSKGSSWAYERIFGASTPLANAFASDTKDARVEAAAQVLRDYLRAEQTVGAPREQFFCHPSAMPGAFNNLIDWSIAGAYSHQAVKPPHLPEWFKFRADLKATNGFGAPILVSRYYWVKRMPDKSYKIFLDADADQESAVATLNSVFLAMQPPEIVALCGFPKKASSDDAPQALALPQPTQQQRPDENISPSAEQQTPAMAAVAAAPAPGTTQVDPGKDNGEEPVGADAHDDESAARELLARWVSAQNDGDFPEYSALYADDFDGEKRSGARRYTFDRAGWLTDRERMFRQPMTVKAIEPVFTIEAGKVVVEFEQAFAQGDFRDRGKKRIIWARAGDTLRIWRELMLDSQLQESGDGEVAAVTCPSAAECNAKGMRRYKSGEYDEALSYFLAAQEHDPSDGLSAYNAACTYALQGNASASVAMLRRFEQSADPRADEITSKVSTDPDFDPIRSAPEFTAWVRRREAARKPSANPDEWEPSLATATPTTAHSPPSTAYTNPEGRVIIAAPPPTR